jgi:hypothetical protein
LPRCSRPRVHAKIEAIGFVDVAALLVLPVVPGDGAVRSFGLDGLAVQGHQHRCHQAE